MPNQICYAKLTTKQQVVPLTKQRWQTFTTHLLFLQFSNKRQIEFIVQNQWPNTTMPKPTNTPSSKALQANRQKLTMNLFTCKKKDRARNRRPTSRRSSSVIPPKEWTWLTTSKRLRWKWASQTLPTLALGVLQECPQGRHHHPHRQGWLPPPACQRRREVQGGLEPGIFRHLSTVGGPGANTNQCRQFFHQHHSQKEDHHLQTGGAHHLSCTPDRWCATADALTINRIEEAHVLKIHVFGRDFARRNALVKL